MSVSLVLLKNGDEINRCTQMLPNQMQCYRGADYTFFNDVTEKTPRQLCRYHAKEELFKEQERLRAEQDKTANPEPPKPEPVKTENKVNVNAKPESHSSYTADTNKK